MKPSTLNRAFASILGVWLALMLRRESILQVNLYYSIAFILIVSFYVIFLHGCLAIHKNRFGRFILISAPIAVLSILALYAIEPIFYPNLNNQLPWQVIAFVGVISIPWVFFSRILDIYAPENEWLRE